MPDMEETLVFRRSREVIFLNMDSFSLSVHVTDVKERSSTDRGKRWKALEETFIP